MRRSGKKAYPSTARDVGRTATCRRPGLGRKPARLEMRRAPEPSGHNSQAHLRHAPPRGTRCPRHVAATVRGRRADLKCAGGTGRVAPTHLDGWQPSTIGNVSASAVRDRDVNRDHPRALRPSDHRPWRTSLDHGGDIAARPSAKFPPKKDWKRARLPTSRHPGEPTCDRPRASSLPCLSLLAQS